jgi:hypothetical protein
MAARQAAKLFRIRPRRLSALAEFSFSAATCAGIRQRLGEPAGQMVRLPGGCRGEAKPGASAIRLVIQSSIARVRPAAIAPDVAAVVALVIPPCSSSARWRVRNRRWRESELALDVERKTAGVDRRGVAGREPDHQMKSAMARS